MLPPPDPQDLRAAHNLLDHADHEIVHWAEVSESNKCVLELSTQWFENESEIQVYIVKNIDSQTKESGLLCDTCNLELDVPNDWEWS
jgi:hypothetical protein